MTEIDRHTAPVAYTIKRGSKTKLWRVVCECDCHRGVRASKSFETMDDARRAMFALYSDAALYPGHGRTR